MEDQISMTVVISGIISIIILIVFFLMAKNISKIKNDISSIKDIVDKYSLKDGVIKQEVSITKPESGGRKVVEPWTCPHCQRENTINDDICEKCGKTK
ncbi:MAG: hypothetical protein QM504_10880 [Pseudomonadota bacterium]